MKKFKNLLQFKVRLGIPAFIIIGIAISNCNTGPDKFANRTKFKENFSFKNLTYKSAVPISVEVSDAEVIRNPEQADSISKPLLLSDLVDDNSFRLVKLETNHDAIIGEFNKVVCGDLGIFILDSKVTNRIVWFDCNGKFISNFSKKMWIWQHPKILMSS